VGPSVGDLGGIGPACGGKNIRCKRLVRTKPDDGHEFPKHVVLILILIFKNMHPLYHTSCVIDYPPT
jgi:hypothetical protein